MSSISSLIGWGLLLSFALLAPVSLPAGGFNNLKGEIRRSDGSGPMFAGDNCELKPIPSAESPSLRFVEAGTPIRILRSWQGPDGNYWLHVQILSFQVSEIVGQATRGWVNV